MTSKALDTTTCTVIPFEQMEELKEEWQLVYGKAATKSLFVSYDYVATWYRHFAAPDQVLIFRIADREGAIGFLPLVRCCENRCRVLKSLTNNHCFHGAALVAAGRERTFTEGIVGELVDSAGSWDLVRFNFTYEFGEEPSSPLFADDVLHRHKIAGERFVQPTFTISLEKKFCDYFSQDLPSKTRKNLRMYTNRIRREGSVKFLHYAGRGAEEQFPRFLDIEDSGWKGAGGSSIKKCAAEYESYYRHFIQLLADQEALHFYFLEYDGKIIAGILGYTDVDVFHCFKVAYDEQYRTLSPSNLLLMHMVEHLMTSSPRTKRLHLFPWDGGYKHRFTNEKAWCVETMLFSPTLRGKLVELCYRMGKAAKKLPGAVSFINSWRRERAGEG